MKFILNDGGRAAAGYRGNTGDCVCRAIAIATQQPYQTVYDALNTIGATERKGSRRRGKSNARTGVYKPTIRRYMESIGWRWVPTMGIGTGCKVHLHDGELPLGRLVVNVSRHCTAVIDGEIHDAFDPQRNVHCGNYDAATGTTTHTISRRCVYGYYHKP